MKTIQKLIFLLMLLLAGNTFLKAQPGGTCPSPDTLTQVANGGPFTNIVWQIAQMDYYLVFTATNDSLDFDIDTNVVNPAHLSQISIIESSCFGTLAYTHVYTGTESIMATGLSPGQLYYIKLERVLSGDEGATHHLNIRSELKTGEYCFTISTNSNTAVLVDFYGTGELVYVMPPTSVDASCNNICIQPCDGPFTVLDTAYIWEIVGPGVYLDAFDLLASAGCFTLPIPASGTATYNINVYYLGDSSLFFTTSITIGTIPSPPPLLQGFTGPFCSFEELINNIDTAVINLDFYPASVVLLDMTDISDYPANYCPPDSMLLTVNGFTLCGIEDTIEFYVYFNQPDLNVGYSIVGCNTVSFISTTTCPATIDSIAWNIDYGCTDFTIYGNNPTYTYPYPGTYFIHVNTIAHCSFDEEFFTINIPGPSGSFTYQYNCPAQSVNFTPTYNCTDSIVSVVWGFGDGTSFTGMYPAVHPYASTGTYSVTMTINYLAWDANICALVPSTYVYTATVNVVVFTGITVSGPPNSCYGTLLTYTVTPTSGTFGGSLTAYIVPSTAATISGGGLIGLFNVNVLDQSQDFTIYFVYTDSYGCTDTVAYNVQGCCNPVPATTTTVKVVPPGGSSSLFSYFAAFGGASIPPPTIIYVNKTFYFYEDVNIDKNHLFVNCTFYIAPGKKIYIVPNKNAFFRNCTLTAMCTQMWAGLRMDNVGAKINFISSRVYHAEIGLELRNNPEVIIGGVTNNRSLFKNCYYGIVAYTTTGLQNFQIDATTFTSDFMGLYAPHATLPYTQTGIYLRGNPSASDAINIGVASAVPSNFNEYNNVYNGIVSYYCSINCLKNHFKDIKTLPFSTLTGSGIFMEAKSPDVTILQANTSSAQNTFETCARNGILTQYGVTMDLRFNTFQNMTGASAIHGINNKNVTQTILSNTISNYKYGINLNGNYNANITIQNNTFNGALVIPSGYGGEAAIYLNDVVSTAYLGDVSSNTINNGRKGIWLVNANSTVLPTGYNSVNVKNNTITFNYAHSPLSTSKVYGIHAETSKDITIDGNTIVYNDVSTGSPVDPVTGHENNLFGIAVDKSTNTEVVGNKILRMGDGIFVAGACNNSRFGCNNFNRCFNGVYFLPGSGVNVPNHLLNSVGLPAPTDNLWTNSTSFGSSVGNSLNSDLAGDIVSPIHWYYSSIVDMPTIFSLSLTSLLGAGGTPEVSINSNICPTLKLGIGPIEKRQTNFDLVITNSMVYENSNQKYNTHRNTLNNLKRNNLIALGLSNDVDYLNYVNDQSNTNIGKLQSIEESFNNQNLLAVDSILSDFIDTNTIETNLKLVYAYYLKLQQGDSLSNADSTILYDLALADPIINGDAVVSAAVLLDLDIPWIISEPKKNEKVEMPEMNIGKILIQPNPTKDKIAVQFECGNNEEKYHYTIYNSVGEVLVNGSLFCNAKNVIDLSTYQNTIFILAVKNINNSVEIFKIVKQ